MKTKVLEKKLNVRLVNVEELNSIIHEFNNNEEDAYFNTRLQSLVSSLNDNGKSDNKILEEVTKNNYKEIEFLQESESGMYYLITA